MSCAATKPCIIYAGKMSIFHIIVHKLFYLVVKALQISCSSTPPTSIPSVCSIRACDQSTHTQTNMHMNSYALLHTFNGGRGRGRCAHIVCLCHTPDKPQTSEVGDTHQTLHHMWCAFLDRCQARESRLPSVPSALKPCWWLWRHLLHLRQQGRDIRHGEGEEGRPNS